MARRQLSVQIDERLVDALGRAATSDTVTPDALVEEALRCYFGLRGLAVLADIEESQAKRGVVPPDGEELLAEAVAEVRAYRAEQRRATG